MAPRKERNIAPRSVAIVIVRTEFIVACVLSRDSEQRHDRPLKTERNTESHADDHRERCRQHHAANHLNTLRVWRQFFAKELPEPSSTELAWQPGLPRAAATSVSANDDHRRLAQAKRVGRRLGNMDPDRIARRQMHPVERALNIGESVTKVADDLA